MKSLEQFGIIPIDYSASTPVQNITIEDLQISVAEISTNATQSYYELTPVGWATRGYTITWTLGTTDVTYPGQSNTTIDLAKGLLNSTYNNFYVTITNNTTGCQVRKIVGGNGFRAARIVNQENEDVRSMETTNSILTQIETESNSTMKLAPNPAHTEVQITLSNEGNAHVQIFSMAGHVVKRLYNVDLNNTLINISDLPTGNYIVVVNQDGNKFREKLVIK